LQLLTPAQTTLAATVVAEVASAKLADVINTAAVAASAKPTCFVLILLNLL
jgi:hypothetical protein